MSSPNVITSSEYIEADVLYLVPVPPDFLGYSRWDILRKI
jgi:hypothetical protein